MVLIACDIGKSGAFSVFNNGVLDDVLDMPLSKILVKKEVRVFKHKDPKVVFKGGANKGKRPTKIKTPAKYKKEIDFKRIKSIIGECQNYDGDIVFISETQFAIAHGKSIYKNHGIITGIAMCYCDSVIEITPQEWQKHFGYNGSDKEKSVNLANSLFDGWEFKSHDQAESALIGKYFLDTK